ncbi:MAG: glycosyltransferase [Phycisphaera sp.]|nr:glycosyltransferase [Phycisphaera sp.]
MTQPLVTIITPTFNAAATLGRTLESIRLQRYTPLELIVVDGGSTDGTLDIVKAQNDLVTRWTSEPDDGIADAFNKGIAAARGELVAILNADDWYEPGALEKIAQAYNMLDATRRGNTILHGDMRMHTGGGRSWLNRPRHWGGRDGLGHSIYFDMPVNHPTCFVPRKVYERVGVFDTSFRVAMDVDFVIRAYRAGVTFHYLKGAGVITHFQVGGASGRRTRLALSEVWRAQRKNRLNPLPCAVSFAGKWVVNRSKALVRALRGR